MHWRWLCVLQLLCAVSCMNILEIAGLKAPLLERRDDNKHNSTSAASGSKTTSVDSSSSISINPALPAGGVNMKTPAASSSSTYVKSGAKVTFAWNYTSLSVSPSAINIEISCSQNSQVYTLARNQSIKTSSIVWDTNKATQDGGLHLISADYTLVIYDSKKSSTDTGTAGMLAPYDYTFSIYLPQKYSPWPQAAKYVNISIRLGPPAFLTISLAALSTVICILV